MYVLPGEWWQPPNKLQELLLSFNGMFLCHPASMFALPRINYGHFRQKLSRGSLPSGETNFLPMRGSILPVIRLLELIPVWGDCWNYLGIPCPQADRPTAFRWPSLLVTQSSNSPLKADSSWVISERAKEWNYRLSGKDWKIRSLEGKNKMNHVEEWLLLRVKV
jgi:hypothetical protein